MIFLVRLFFTIIVIIAVSKNAISMHSSNYHQLYELLIKHEFVNFNSKAQQTELSRAERKILKIRDHIENDAYIQAYSELHFAIPIFFIGPNNQSFTIPNFFYGPDYQSEEMLIALCTQPFPSLRIQEHITADEYFALALTLAEFYIHDDTLEIAQFILEKTNLSDDNDPYLHACKYKLQGDIYGELNLYQQAENAYKKALSVSQHLPTFNYLTSLNLADLYTHHNHPLMTQTTLESMIRTNHPHLSHLYKLSYAAHKLRITAPIALTEDFQKLKIVQEFFRDHYEFALCAKAYALLAEYAVRLKNTNAAELYTSFAKDIVNKSKFPKLMRHCMNQEYEETAHEKLEIVKQHLEKLSTLHPVYDAPTQPLSAELPADGGVFVGE